MFLCRKNLQFVPHIPLVEGGGVMKSYTRSSTPPPPDMSSYAPQAANYNKERLNSPETLAEWTCLYRMIYICTMDPYGPPPPPLPLDRGWGAGGQGPLPSEDL